MSERLTIADSKKAFHKAFPHVIPPIYRRVTDELLVELHLLSHQKGFKPDVIFAIGLSKVFDTFTRGYRPEQHLESLFQALCTSNGLDPMVIREHSEQTLEAIKANKSEEIKNWMKNKGSGAPDKLAIQIDQLSKGNSHYSRLISIGLLTLLMNSKEEKITSSIQTTICEIGEIFGFSKGRVERDLNQYTSNLDKISQALELMKESIEHERKKKANIATNTVQDTKINDN